MQAMATAGQLDWSGWRLGILRSIIQGGSHATLAGGIISIADPDKYSAFNLATAEHLVLLTLAIFVGGGFLRLMFFLNDHPLADVQTVTTTTTEQKIKTVEKVTSPPDADVK